MKNAGFRGPRPESFDILFCAYCDRDILMPRNLPIRLWDLVEEDATDRENPLSEHCLSQFTHRKAIAAKKLDPSRCEVTHAIQETEIERLSRLANAPGKGWPDSAGIPDPYSFR